MALRADRLKAMIMSCLKIFAFISCLITLASCDVFLGCLLDERMNLKTDSLPQGQIDEEYYAELTASVKNSIWDSHFDYDYEVEDGVLPAGLILQSDGDNAIITGVPEEAGTFPITIEVFSRDLAFLSSYDNCVDAADNRAFQLVITAEEILPEDITEEEFPEEID